MMPHSGALHGQSRKVQYWARDPVHHGSMGPGTAGELSNVSLLG